MLPGQSAITNLSQSPPIVVYRQVDVAESHIKQVQWMHASSKGGSAWRTGGGASVGWRHMRWQELQQRRQQERRTGKSKGLNVSPASLPTS